MYVNSNTEKESYMVCLYVDRGAQQYKHIYIYGVMEERDLLERKYL